MNDQQKEQSSQKTQAHPLAPTSATHITTDKKDFKNKQTAESRKSDGKEKDVGKN